jgi:hypothetical protein
MSSFKGRQQKYVKRPYRKGNWAEYEAGLRRRASLTVWLAVNDVADRERNRNIRSRAQLGKRDWRQKSSYSLRAKVETTVSRYKVIFGPAIRARSLAAQRAEGRGCRPRLPVLGSCLSATANEHQGRAAEHRAAPRRRDARHWIQVAGRAIDSGWQGCARRAHINMKASWAVEGRE